MITKDFSILLCTNGLQSNRPALEYGAWLAGLLGKEVVLLGLAQDPRNRSRLDSLMEETSVNLSQRGIRFSQQVEPGPATEAIARIAETGKYLTVFGPLGRPAWQRVVLGRSFRRLLVEVETPLLYVPKACLPLRRVLICMGGLEFALSVEHLGLLIAQAASASITLLHVVEPMNLNYQTTKEIRQHPDNILESDTPQSRSLRRALTDIRSAGMAVELKIRHGSIVHEILDEVHSNDYDLLGLGSPYSTKSLRHLYMPNVTAEVAEAANRPVLTVRMGQDLFEPHSV